MALGGLWHGVKLEFRYSGVFCTVWSLTTHKLWMKMRGLDNKDAPQGGPISRISGWALTYLFVCVGWVFFRAQTETDALLCLGKMVGAMGGGLEFGFPAGSAFSCLLSSQRTHWACGGKSADIKPMLNLDNFGHLILLFSWLLGLFFLSSANSAPFIYFQF